MKPAALLLALPLSAAVIDVNSQPNYSPQLAPPYVLSVPASSLLTGFPQLDYSGSAGLTCYLKPYSPASHDVCTTPAASGFVLIPGPLVPVPTPAPTPSPVPEVSAWRMAIAGLGMLVISELRWRRR